MASVIYFFIFSLLATPFANASGDSTCLKFYKPSLVRSMVSAVKQWSTDVKETKGRSLVLVPPSPSSEQTKWKGILREPAPFSLLSKVVQAPVRWGTRQIYGRAFEIHPIKAFSENIVQPTVRHVTTTYFKQSFQLSRVFLLTTSIVSGIFAYNYYDAKASQWTHEKAVAQYKLNTPLYESWLAHDYRYETLRKDASLNKITRDDAIALSAKLREALNAHLARVTENKDLSETYENNAWVDANLSDPAFGNLVYSDIHTMINNGIKYSAKLFKETSNFSPQLNETQIKDLVQSRDLIMLELEVAEQWINSSAQLANWMQSPLGQSLLKDIQNDPFNKHLEDLFNKGKISKGRLLNLVQENIFWKGKFQQWQILNIHPLKKDNDTLKIDDIQTETLQQLEGV